MNAVTDDLTPGVVIQDTYRIDRLLGEGGMGATFAGHNLALDHPVAIKVISQAFAANKRAVDLFKREAALLRTLRHDAIVTYETTQQDAKGRLYLVMELLDGRPLSHYVERGARLSAEDTLKLGRRLASALDAIAAAGTVHRDIAPDNIFVPGGDILRAKLIDFGLASNTVGTEKSILGQDIAGKFSYFAPEQFGQFDGRVSPKSDAYALGLVLMKVFGLPIPGEGEGMAAGAARRADLDIPRDRTGPALHGVLSALLRADPSSRPGPLTPVFERALASTGQDAPRSERTEAAVSGAVRRKKRGKAKVIVWLAAGALATAAVAAFLLLPAGDGPGGQSVDQGIAGQEALAADDPMAEIRAMMAEADAESLNAALGALIEMGGDTARPDDERVAALVMAAEMADPETHDASASSFEAPDAGFARRMYRAAADLGSEDAARAAARLQE